MQLKIEKGVPIPATTARSGDNMDLLRSMEIGDSVFFDAPIAKKATRFYRVAKKLGIFVLIRKDKDGMRLWRVAPPTGEAATPKETAAVVVKKAKKAALPKGVAKAKPAAKPKVTKALTKAEKDAAAKRAKRAAAKKAEQMEARGLTPAAKMD